MIASTPPDLNFQSISESDYSDHDFSADAEDDSDADDESYTNLPDIDQRNINNPTKIARYAEIIFSIAREESQLIFGFGEQISETTPDMHEIAIKWLFSIQSQYQMSSNSLYEAVFFLRTVLSKSRVELSQLQLITVTCIWLAAKVEDRVIPNLKDLCYICSNRYKAEEFVKCERELLRTLDFKLNYPTPKFFLRRLTDAIDAEPSIIEVSNFFCELSLIPLDFVNFEPAVIAMSSICLGKLSMKEFCPTKRLMAYAHIDSLNEVKRCAKLLIFHAALIMSDNGHFLYKKFTNENINKSILDMELDIDIDRLL